MRERVIYYSEDDLTIGLNLGPAVEVLNVFTPDKDYSLEDLVELFHVNQIITKAKKPNDWTKDYKLDGVASHPGDIGMQHIADCYYATINALMKN